LFKKPLSYGICDLIKEKKLFLLDGNGTLYLRSRPVITARDFLSFLKNKNKEYLIMTNNSSYSKS